MVASTAEIEQRLWAAADDLRANSGLRASEYSTPVLGLIFLRYADHRFGVAERELAGKADGRWEVGKAGLPGAGGDLCAGDGAVLGGCCGCRRGRTSARRSTRR